LRQFFAILHLFRPTGKFNLLGPNILFLDLRFLKDFALFFKFFDTSPKKAPVLFSSSWKDCINPDIDRNNAATRHIHILMHIFYTWVRESEGALLPVPFGNRASNALMMIFAFATW